MKYCVLIMDGAAGLPLAKQGDKTCLELADAPHLDTMAREGTVGLVRTVPPGMEPSSLAACLSILGYDPVVYPLGRAAIEARSLGIDVGEGEVAFRANLVTVENGIMRDYSAGHISSEEARNLIRALQEKLGNDDIHFYPGTSYRHVCVIKEPAAMLGVTCTPPHDISDQPIKDFLPQGEGSVILEKLMASSIQVLEHHPVNEARIAQGQPPATMLWLSWGSRRLPDMPPFEKVYGRQAALTSGVDLLQGMARLVGMDVLGIAGVTDGTDNDYAAQAEGALAALAGHDLVVIHIEAPDEAAHSGRIDEKIKAIEAIDREVVARICSWLGDRLRVLIMPDHPTPITLRTHTAEPVPFVLWGEGFPSNGAAGFSEAEAAKTSFYIENGYKIMGRLVE